MERKETIWGQRAALDAQFHEFCDNDLLRKDAFQNLLCQLDSLTPKLLAFHAYFILYYYVSCTCSHNVICDCVCYNEKFIYLDVFSAFIVCTLEILSSSKEISSCLYIILCVTEDHSPTKDRGSSYLPQRYNSDQVNISRLHQ